MKLLQFFVVLCASLLVFVIAGPAIAQGPTREPFYMDDDYEKEEFREPPKNKDRPTRDLVIEQERHWVNIMSHTQNYDHPLFFDFHVEANDHLSIRATYSGLSEEGGDKTGIDLDFTGMVEYKDVNGDGMFEAGVDKVFSTYPLSYAFYETDFFRGQNEFKEVDFEGEETEYYESFSEMDYIDGFNVGFDKGFGIGYDMGIEDFDNGEDPNPVIFEHDEEWLMNLLEEYWMDPEFEEDWEEEDFEDDGYPDEEYPDERPPEEEYPRDEYKDEEYPDERPPEDEYYDDDWDDEDYEDREIAWFDYGFFNGLIQGFEKGYNLGFHHAKEDAEEEQPKTRNDPPPPPPEDEKEPYDEKPPEDMTEEEKKLYEERRIEEKAYYDEYGKYIDGGYVDPLDFGNKLYQPIKISKEKEGNKISSLMIKVRDIKGVFGIDVKIGSGLVQVENGYLPPSAVKIDIKITDYPYTQKDTQVALLMDMGMVSHTAGDLEVEKKDKSWDEEQGYATDEEEFRISGADFQGFFSWVKYAMCDGKNLSVGVVQTYSFYGSYWQEQGQFTENYKGVAFCYPRAKKIVHDPKIGFISVQNIDVYSMSGVSDAVESLLNGNIWIYLISGFIAIGFVVVSRKLRTKYY